MIKKQRKDGDEVTSSEKKNQAENEVKAEEKDKETTAGNAASNNGENTEGEGKNGEEKKEPSEVDVLKLYLQQVLENLKKEKDENDSLKTQVEQLNEKLKQCNERYVNLAAEYENYRRRTAAEKENLGIDATAKVVNAILPPIDNLERAIPFADQNPESFKTGVEMTLKQFIEALNSLGVEEIEAEGAEFNPELHEAVMHADDENYGESVITEVYQKGYRLGDRVIRHSKVKVVN